MLDDDILNHDSGSACQHRPMFRRPSGSESPGDSDVRVKQVASDVADTEQSQAGIAFVRCPPLVLSGSQVNQHRRRQHARSNL